MPYSKAKTLDFLTRFHKNKPKESNKLAYLAGLMDGEGYVKFEKWGTIRSVIGMTDYSTIKWIHNNFGGTFNRDQILKSGKRFYVWRLNNSLDNLKLMILLYPYMITKKELILKTLQLLLNRLKKLPRFESLNGLRR